MQFTSPLPDIAIEGDQDHPQLHNDARALLEEMVEADLQSQDEVNAALGSGWVYRVRYVNGAYEPRNPLAKYHDYVGPVQPTGMVEGDSWADSSAS